MKPTLSPGYISAPSDTLYGSDGLLFQEGDYAHDLRMPTHVHGYAHFVFNLTGKVTLVCRKRSRLFASGSLNFLPLGEPHSNHFQDGVRAFQIVLKPQWIERVERFSALPKTPIDYESGPSIGLAMRLYREFQHRDNLAPLMLEGLLLELLAVMSRQDAHDGERYPPRWLKQARSLLHDRFTESLSTNAIAEAVGVHPSHLMERFRQHYHCTVGDYVRRLRIDYACQLLSASAMPPAQIALAAGFADQSHFCRTFKQYTGMTPTQFQQVSATNPSLRQDILA